MAFNNAINNSVLLGATGSGNFVGANTPTLITPALGVATGTSLNLGGSTLINGMINDNTMASASATTLASSSSIKSYSDTSVYYDDFGSQTASSSASINFTNLDLVYQIFIIELHSFVPATNGVGLIFRTSTNGGSSYDSAAGNYTWAGNTASASAITAIGSTSATSLGLTNTSIGNTANFYLSGRIYIMPNYNAGGAFLRVISQLTYTSTAGAGNIINAYAGGWRTSTTQINAVQVLFTSGNITSGTTREYGISNV